MAFAHLRESLTRGNLWIYILAALEEGPHTPVELRAMVSARHGFEPATITFYSVLYKLRREGLVRKSTAAFRSKYELTSAGERELGRALDLLQELRKGLDVSAAPSRP